MATPTPRDLIIIGSGPAGLTAAIYAARADLKPRVIAGNTPGGQLMLTTEVENFPGFPGGITGPELMKRMREQAQEHGAEILNEDVTAVDFHQRPFRITVGNTTHEARAVIVATGAKAKWLGLPKEQRLIGRGTHVCATCDGFAYRGKDIAVVGGGDAAMEEALTLAKIAASVTIIVRTEKLRASNIMAERAQTNPKIRFIWNSVVTDVLGDQRVTGLRLKNAQTNEEQELPTNAVFIAIGYTPASQILTGQLEVDAKGYVIVHDRTHSSVDGVFIAGDIEDHRYRQAVTAAAGGCMAALDAAKWLAEYGKL